MILKTFFAGNLTNLAVPTQISDQNWGTANGLGVQPIDRKLSFNNAGVGTGYSGTGAGRDNPAMQDVRNVGPIPQGVSTIGPPHDTKTHGPFVMALTLAPGTKTFGRAGFLIHGDNKRHDALHGCIILGPQLRHRIWSSGDRSIQITQ